MNNPVDVIPLEILVVIQTEKYFSVCIRIVQRDEIALSSCIKKEGQIFDSFKLWV